MRPSRFPLGKIIVILACLFVAAAALSQNMGDKMLELLQKDYKPEAPLLPADVKIVAEYKDGANEPAGIIDFVENEAFVMHADEQGVAYRAAKSGVVCTGDTLVAEDNSRMVVLLKDQSRFTVAAYTKLTIDKSVYDPDRNLRDTVLDLAAGKARVVAKKLQTAGEENFKVRTPVATCGIRGSDFVISLVPANQLPDWRRSLFDRFTPVGTAHAAAADPGQPGAAGPHLVVLTGAETTLSVTGPIGPPVIIESFHISAFFPDRPPPPPFPLPPQSVPGVMNKIGPTVSVMSMPKAFD